MPYADTDFFLAIIKKEDWLKTNAQFLYRRFKNQIYTSFVTVIELLLICEKYKLDPEKVIISIYKICNINNKEKALIAAHYMKHNKLRAFDALHAAFTEDEIISSDSVFDELGIKRIKLER